jgi:hypothetical protein
VDHVGVPLKLLTNYGQVEEHDEHIGMTSNHIKKRIEHLIG